MTLLDHEQMDVYQVALDLAVLCEAAVKQLPMGRGYIADQLRRASLSVVNNVAEGAGEYAQREKRRFYRMGRRSATECVATLDLCRRLELVPEATYEECRTLVVRVVAMLIGLSRA